MTNNIERTNWKNCLEFTIERIVEIPKAQQFPNLDPTLPPSEPRPWRNPMTIQLCVENLSKINTLTSQLSMEFHKTPQTLMPFTCWNWYVVMIHTSLSLLPELHNKQLSDFDVVMFEILTWHLKPNTNIQQSRFFT